MNSDAVVKINVGIGEKTVHYILLLLSLQFSLFIK
jgi:hypothetical protein